MPRVTKLIEEIPKVPDIRGEMWIPFSPVAKGRPRMSRNGGVYTPKKTRDAETLIRDFVETHHCIPEPIPYPLEMEIIFFFKHLGPPNWHVKKPDIDNTVKLICDSLGPYTYTYLGSKKKKEGILYVDDCQVCSLITKKYWHKDQGLWIKWRTLGAPEQVEHPLARKP